MKIACADINQKIIKRTRENNLLIPYKNVSKLITTLGALMKTNFFL